MSVIAALLWRDLLRLIRQPTRILALVGTGALVWALLGGGLAGVRLGADDGLSYPAYVLPGVVTMVVLFSCIFGAIGLIEDRREGIVQGALVSPAPMWAVMGARVLSCGLFGGLQGGVVLLGSPIVGVGTDLTGALTVASSVLCVGLGIGGVGLALAWRINSTAGFHGVMNLLLMPMWVLSGSVFPAQTGAGWVGAIARVNPLGWATEVLRSGLGMGHAGLGQWLGMFAFAGSGMVFAVACARRGED